MPNFTVPQFSATRKDSQLPITASNQAPNQVSKSQLPPIEILLDWLAYIHAQTGEWPLPPGKNSSQDLDFSTSEKANITANNHQMPNSINKLRLVKPIEPITEHVIGKTFFSTGYDYVNSVYFKEACRIIATHATQPLNSKLEFGCKLTLSLIIAWCQSSLFKQINNRQGRWMILATQHCTRELHIRTDTFKHYLNELEKAGLLVIENAGDGQLLTRQEFEQLKMDCSKIELLMGTQATHFWNKRTLQSKTAIYCLTPAIELAVDLPLFRPFSDAKLSNVSGKTSQIDNAVKTIENTNCTVEKSSQVYSCYESINHDDVNKPLEIKKLAETNFPEMTPEQEECFTFLDKEASFEGYARSDGRITLDTQQALKIALTKNLSLELLKERYTQVKQMWLSGQCRKNPLGLFYWAITNNQNPGSSELPQPLAPSVKKQFATKSTNPKHSGKQSGNISQQKLQKWKLLQTPPTVQDSSVIPAKTENEIELEVCSEVSFDAEQLWQEIRQSDLPGRFRLNAEQLTLLEGSRLEVASYSQGQQIHVVLRSAIEDYQLQASSRQIIQLAIRQKIDECQEISFRIDSNS